MAALIVLKVFTALRALSRLTFVELSRPCLSPLNLPLTSILKVFDLSFLPSLYDSVFWTFLFFRSIPYMAVRMWFSRSRILRMRWMRSNDRIFEPSLIVFWSSSLTSLMRLLKVFRSMTKVLSVFVRFFIIQLHFKKAHRSGTC